MSAAASMVTGIKAINFNPVGVQQKTVERHGVDLNSTFKSGKIEAYRVRGEALTTVENWWALNGYIPPSNGVTYTIPASAYDNTLDRHGMDAVLQGLGRVKASSQVSGKWLMPDGLQ